MQKGLAVIFNEDYVNYLLPYYASSCKKLIVFIVGVCQKRYCFFFRLYIIKKKKNYKSDIIII